MLFLFLPEVSYLTCNWLAFLEEIPGFMNSSRRDCFFVSGDKGFSPAYLVKVISSEFFAKFWYG